MSRCGNAVSATGTRPIAPPHANSAAPAPSGLPLPGHFSTARTSASSPASASACGVHRVRTANAPPSLLWCRNSRRGPEIAVFDVDAVRSGDGEGGRQQLAQFRRRAEVVADDRDDAVFARRARDADPRGELLRRGQHDLLHRGQDLDRVRPRPEHHARRAGRGRPRLEREARVDAEVAAPAAAAGPEQVRVLGRRRGDDLAGSEHDVGRDQRVAREAVRAGDRRDAAAEGQAADADGVGVAERERQVPRPQPRVQRLHRRPAADGDQPGAVRRRGSRTAARRSSTRPGPAEWPA